MQKKTALTTYRVFVSTDLGGDPDDIQSLVHLLHYSDVLKLEGIISTTGPSSVPKAENIKYWIKRTDLDYLREQGHPDLMTEKEVLTVVRQGAKDPRGPLPGGATDGSNHLIDCAHRLGRETDNVLWVLVWGSMTDVAQALYDDPSISGKIRINCIGSSNTTHDPESRDYVYSHMEQTDPNLWWIEDGILPRLSKDTFRGYYLGGNQEGEWGNKAFVDRVIRGNGTDRQGEFSEKLGDVFPLAEHPGGIKDILKEGDSPTFMYLLSPQFGGVGDEDDPTQLSWGGTFRRPCPDTFPNYYTDLDASAVECQSTISRWRVDFLKHWKERWDRYHT